MEAIDTSAKIEFMALYVSVYAFDSKRRLQGLCLVT